MPALNNYSLKELEKLIDMTASAQVFEGEIQGKVISVDEDAKTLRIAVPIVNIPNFHSYQEKLRIRLERKARRGEPLPSAVKKVYTISFSDKSLTFRGPKNLWWPGTIILEDYL